MKKEIIIIGGGVVGLCMAASLAQLDFDVAVLDANAIEIDPSNEIDLRVYAINAASQKLLNEVGAWQKILDSSLSPYRNMHVWDESSTGVLSFGAQELGIKQLGHIIEEKRLKNALLEVIGHLSNVSLHGHCKLKSVDISETAAFVQTSNGDMSAKLIIGADGANSWLRNHLDFNCTATPYPHHAIVCNLTTELPHNKTAFQIFTKEGPLAFLPFANKNQCSIVCSVSPAKAKALMAQSELEFAESICQSFQSKLGSISKVSKRVCFPLVERVVDPFIKSRALLIGDALHTIHPLAGLGVNLGLEDVAAVIKSIKHYHLEFDAYQTLRHYERSRKGQVKSMTLLMSLLQKSFSTGGIPPLIRGAGMDLISQSTFIKSKIIGFAMGTE